MILEKIAQDILKYPHGKKSDDLINNLFIVPKKDKGSAMPKFGFYKPGIFSQSDLIFLPHDGNYSYALVVAEVGYPRVVDAEPIVAKDAKTIITAFKKIYQRKIVKPTSNMTVDSGSEFKGDVGKYLESIGINVKTAMVGRHRQVGIVERKNQIIGSIIHRIHKMVEKLTGRPTTQWVNLLPKIIEQINIQAKKTKKPKQTDDFTFPNEDTLMQGEKIRVILEEPRDQLTKQRLNGKFRSSDFRWDSIIRTVTEVIIKPNSPILYLVSGIPHVAYTRNQLQRVSNNEKGPKKEILELFDDNSNTGEIEKIVSSFVDLDNRIWYNVKFKKVRKISQIHREQLMVDAPKLVKLFEKKNSNKK